MGATDTKMAEDEVREIANMIRVGRIDPARLRARALIAAGNDADALLAIAAMLESRGGDEALARNWLESLHARRPQDEATRINLARFYLAEDNFERVVTLLRPVTPRAASDRLLAYAILRLGTFAEARDLYDRVLTADRSDAESWANFAEAHAALGEGDAAVDALEWAVTARPDEPRFYLALTALLERLDRPIARLKVATDAASRFGGNHLVQFALGLAEAAMDRSVAAEAAFRRAIDLAPDDPAAYLELGLLFETHNRLAALDELIVLARPHIGDEIALLEAWAAFRAMQFERAGEFAARIPETINDLRRSQILAQIADRLGDSDEAWAGFTNMNKAALRESPAPPAGPSYRQTVVASMAANGVPRITHLDASPPERAAPEFLVGFPRSGTTLLDTMLGRMPDTIVLEEQPILPTIEKETGVARDLRELEDAEIRDIRRRYWGLLDEVSPDGAAAARIVDKHPLHMARMPLIAAMFPNARILFVERHPCDVVLSCFMANFRLNQAMRSFTSIEEAALTYAAVFDAWTQAERIYPVRVHRVRYERLVADPAVELGAALKFLDTKFDPQMLDNVSAARERAPVRTASYSQITEPIYQRSVYRWERYRLQLTPVLPVLEPWAERMGYHC